MSVLESLGVDVFGLAIVFAVLIALSFIIKLISMAFRPRSAAAAATPEGQPAQDGESEITLVEVDEKTAAAIMAIVSKNSGIPLARLRFNSIRRIKEAEK